ncbi:MAG TPA: hypothetical protein VF187_10935, partial [Gemmatimonadales bacterium]
MTQQDVFAGDPIPPHSEIIEVRVRELRQLFNAIDPSPFHERDLDPDAEDFIVNWAGEIPASVPVGLMVHVERPAGAPDEADHLRSAVHQFFARKAETARRRLRELFGRGRISLLIGLAFLGASSVLANALSAAVDGNDLARILRESLLIGGWVAMWRPLEVFLYDWWPIRAQARRYDRLAGMPVRIQYATEGKPDAWRRDWPTLPAG